MGMFVAIYIAIILIGGSMGFPMGMPPGPEDPMMAKIAPEDCAFYASWSGVAKTDPNANPSEKWMSQPKTSKAIARLRKSYRAFLLKRAEDFEPTSKLSTEMLVEVIDAGSINPVGAYINKLKVEEKQVSFRGAIVVSLGDRKAAVAKQFDDLFKLASQYKPTNRDADYSAIGALEANGERIIEIASPVDDLPIRVTLRDNYFVLGLGKDSLAEVAANSKTAPPKWLADLKTRLTVKRVGSVGYVDMEQAQDLFRLPFWEFGLGTTMSVFIEEVESMGVVSGMDEKGCLSRSEIKTGKHPKGLLSIIDLEPIPKHFLEDVPADTTVGAATRLSTERILELVKETAKNAGQEEAINDSLQKFQKVTGVSLEEELLAAVGDYVHAYYTLDVNNWNAGWVISVRIEDEMSFPGIFEELNRGLKKWIADLERTEFSVTKHGLHEIYSVKTRNASTDFAWAVVDDQWYFSRKPDDIIKHLEGQPKENQYLNDPTVKEIFEFGKQNGLVGPVAITHLNMPSIFEAVRPFVGPFPFSDEDIYEDFDFRWSDIPSIDELVNGVRPNFTAIYKSEEGFQILQRQTYPGSSPPVSVAAMAIGALPTQMADMAARNRLKRIGKAHLDFNEKHKHFCAAYSSDAEGSALLSWRVHLLPFLGHGDLYKEFRLDEPWNSAHNFLLLEKMPEIYKHPSIKLSPNKTVFLTSRRNESAFAAPQNPGSNPPQGFKIGEIADGPATTAMIIEQGQDSQVFWTQPEDTKGNGHVIRNNARGIRDARHFCIVTLDGNVHMLSEWTSTKMLDNMINRNDGKEVQLPKNWYSR